MACRYWTAGYDFAAPGCQLAFHLWDRSYRPTFASDLLPPAPPPPPDTEPATEPGAADPPPAEAAGRAAAAERAAAERAAAERAVARMIGQRPAGGGGGGGGEAAAPAAVVVAAAAAAAAEGEPLDVASRWAWGYGLGSARPLAEYGALAGVDWAGAQVLTPAIGEPAAREGAQPQPRRSGASFSARCLCGGSSWHAPCALPCARPCRD